MWEWVLELEPVRELVAELELVLELVAELEPVLERIAELEPVRERIAELVVVHNCIVYIQMFHSNELIMIFVYIRTVAFCLHLLRLRNHPQIHLFLWFEKVQS